MQRFYGHSGLLGDEGCDSHTKGVSRPKDDRANITHVWGVRYTEPKYFPIPPERVAHLVRCWAYATCAGDGRHLRKAHDTPNRDTPMATTAIG